MQLAKRIKPHTASHTEAHSKCLSQHAEQNRPRLANYVYEARLADPAVRMCTWYAGKQQAGSWHTTLALVVYTPITADDGTTDTC